MDIKYKLVKTNSCYYLVDAYNNKGIIGSSGDSDGKLLNLSLENCKYIEHNIIFDYKFLYDNAIVYAAKSGHPHPAGFSDEQVGLLHGYIDGFENGFLKALDSLSDNMFTKEEIIEKVMEVKEKFRTEIDSYGKPKGIMTKLNSIIDIKHKTEFDVIISGFSEKDGCEILKRI